MIEKVRDWLNEEVDHRGNDFEPPVKVPRHERIAFLLSCNGGSLMVRQWGITGWGGGPFRTGLSQEEAFELMEYGAFISGIEFILGDCRYILRPLVAQWRQKQIDAYEQIKVA